MQNITLFLAVLSLAHSTSWVTTGPGRTSSNALPLSTRLDDSMLGKPVHLALSPHVNLRPIEMMCLCGRYAKQRPFHSRVALGQTKFDLRRALVGRASESSDENKGELDADDCKLKHPPRRRGRDANKRRPDLDSPLRDGNRDRLSGILTDRASKTLLYYCSETNQNLYRWLYEYIKHNPIPHRGAWEDVSGETFLRTLLTMPVNLDVRTTYGIGVDPMYDCSESLSVDPRQVARRIMEIRTQLANEWKEDLDLIQEENTELMRDAMMSQLPKMVTTDESSTAGSPR